MWFRKILNEDSLRGRCLRACSWTAAGMMSAQAIRMVRLFLLTYLLSPAEFGILTLTWGIFYLLQEFSDTGIKYALIQNRQAQQQEYLNTAWLMNLTRNLGLMVILYLIAPYIARTIYHKEQLQNLLKLCGLILLFDGLTSIGLVALRKQLIVKPIIIINIISSSVVLLVTIGLAWRLRSAVAVVIGEIIGTVIICISSYYIHPYRPRGLWKTKAFVEMINYGIMTYIIAMIDAFGMRLDVLILGRMASDSEIGLYGLAMAVIAAIVGLFSHITVSVGFPAFALIQHDKSAVKKAAAELFRIVQLVSIPIFASIAILGPDLAKILPDRFSGVGQPLRYLSIFGFFMVFLRQLTPILYAINRLHWVIIRGLIHLAMLAPLSVPMYQHLGLVGMCWAVNISVILSDIFLWLVTLRQLQWPWRRWGAELTVLWQCTLAGAAGFIIVYGLLAWAGWQGNENAAIRWVSLLAGLAGYIAWVLRYYWPRLSGSGKIPPGELTESGL